MLTVVRPSVTASAPGKVNLHLGVEGLRADGYHELTTVFCALSLRDKVTVSTSDHLHLTVSGENAEMVPTDETNLAWQAAEMVAEHCNAYPAVHIHIDKTIPVAGGMAGGSADAAAALVACNEYFQADLDRDTLLEMALALGSDVPFCITGGTALGTGRGEQLLPVLNRTTLHFVIAIAKEGLSTPAVFREYDRLQGKHPATGNTSPDGLLTALAGGDISAIAQHLDNDLQAAALSLYPELRYTLRAGMEAGALGGIVSGSGPTCAFLCADSDSVLSVSAELAGAGVCKTVRHASGPVPGVVLEDEAE
ncbi:MAG: 4-(cytidine 5'-diphospho)-2-C-methyl-D-erythritol kinase [Lawsonella sp.]